MKANELMIGDWVNVVVKWKPEIKYMYGEVSELLAPDGYLKVRQSYDPYHDNEIYCICDTEPILLTPEILEKNGYRNSVLVDDYFIAHGVHYNVDSKCIMFGYEYGSVLEVECKYVHELQHALRLFGIEKEIVL